MFILTLAIILAVIGVVSWSFFGNHARPPSSVSTASTSINPPIEIASSPSSEIREEHTQEEKGPAAPAISPTEQEVPVVDNLPREEPVDTAQETIPAQANQTSAPSTSEGKAADNNFSEPESAPRQMEEANKPSETAPETVPLITSTREVVADAKEDTPPSSDSLTPAPPAEDKTNTVTETPPVIQEGKSDTTLNASLGEIETSDQTEPPAPSTELNAADETMAVVQMEDDNESQTPEEASRSEDRIEPDTSQSTQETVEPGPEATEENTTTPEAVMSPLGETIAEDTRLPWQKYAAVFNENDERPRIAIVISEAGISSARTREAIEKLPPEMTLGFNPYGQNLQKLVDLARGAGHEVLLQLPMEPMGYPRIDPGPQAMRTDLSETENRSRLEWSLNRFTGYAGVTNQMGSKFTSERKSIQPILQTLKELGYLYLDSRTASNSVAAEIAQDLDIPVAINNRFLDHKADGALIDARLAELESIARSTGSAIGIAYPHGETFRHLSDWADTLDRKGLTLAPVSALVKDKGKQ